MNSSQNIHPAGRAEMRGLLEEVSRRERDIAAFLPDGVRIDRFMALARRAIQEQPALAECSTGSVLRALRECALSGLELDGQFSTLIVRRPRQGKPIASWDATFRGMTWQALASGLVRGVEAQVVREQDDFSIELGSEPKLVHRPCISRERGPVICAYAVAVMASGAKLFELLTREDLARIRAASPAGERGPWGPWEDEMARKSAIRRLLKKLPAGKAQSFGSRCAANSTSIAQPDRAQATSSSLPEDEYALECRALERLSNATSIAEIDTTWAQAQLEYRQLGRPSPLVVEAKWHELRECLSDPSRSA